MCWMGRGCARPGADPAAHAEFAVNAGQVGLDGFDADVQGGSDLGIAAAGGDEFGDPPLGPWEYGRLQGQGRVARAARRQAPATAGRPRARKMVAASSRVVAALLRWRALRCAVPSMSRQRPSSNGNPRSRASGMTAATARTAAAGSCWASRKAASARPAVIRAHGWSRRRAASCSQASRSAARPARRRHVRASRRRVGRA